jgi:hypothetical protein
MTSSSSCLPHNGGGTRDGDHDDDDPAAGRRPMPRNALPCASKRIAHVELFRPKTIIVSHGSTAPSASPSPISDNANAEKQRRGRGGPPLKKYQLLFVALYLHQAHWIYRTLGVPYRDFLDKAEREGFEGESDLFSHGGGPLSLNLVTVPLILLHI